MELKPGAKLGPYEILSRIGAGGMGEVWKARDTRLDRVVAIKTSAARFGERFEREARAVAALNHPHICTLYDVGPDYLVMEFVEGTEIKGPLPLDRALALAIHLAGALEAAHRKGITHRDLKPANILVTKTGIKVLDFGLAKFAQADVEESSETVSIAKGLTQEGAIVGTLQYMAPEQLQGKPTDARADIFSFGCVLHEMLTGKRAFDGSNTVSVIAAIMERPAPPIGDVAPASLDWALRRCLAKNPDERWQSASDLRAVLERVAGGESEIPGTAVRPLHKAWMIAAAMFAFVTAGLAFIHFRETPPQKDVVNLSITLPPESSLGYLAVSPDGRFIVATGLGGPTLYLRSLDSPEFRPVPGTEGARVPFWSPDSRQIGFFADAKLKITAITGGPATVLCDQTGLGLGGTWNRDGVILFSSGVLAAGPYGEGFLRRVNASGGACTAVAPGGQGASDDNTGAVPEFLPDGNHFLYASSGAVYAASIDGSMKRRKILNDNSSALYAPPVSGHGSGQLLFLRAASLMTQPFDAETLMTTGEGVRSGYTAGAIEHATSDAGQHCRQWDAGLGLPSEPAETAEMVRPCGKRFGRGQAARGLYGPRAVTRCEQRHRGRHRSDYRWHMAVRLPA
jgi:serine/threonine protein kinase